MAGIPVMLTFITPFHEQFAASHSAELGALGATLPAGHPRTGEESTQATFTAEWEHATNSDLSFIFDGNDLVALNREVWLAGLHDTPPRTILDVGCGAGQEAIALGRVFPQAQISAVDLNFSMLTRVGELAESETPVDFAVASLFALPFPDASFDLVYSEGVLHHTYSTREAFNAIALKVAEGGHLFVWLYGRDDLGSLRGRRRVAATATVLIERLLRPAISRAPRALRDSFFAVATTATHPILKPRMRHTSAWERANTEHHLRDWLSPRYAHRHGFNEVAEWFEEAGFAIVGVQSPAAYRRLFSEPLLGVGILGVRLA